MKRLVLLLCMAGVFAVPVLGATVRAADKPVTFATYLGWGSETDAQYIFFLTELFSYLKAELKVSGEYRHYTSEQSFFKDFVDAPGERYAIVGFRKEMVELMRDHGFEPVLTTRVGGLKRNRACVYARRESKAKSLAALRGGAIATYEGPFGHVLMRSVLGERPDKFFKKIEETTTGLEAVYMISLKEVDAIFVTDQIMWFLKNNNPGAVRGLEKITCSHEYEFLPLLGRDTRPGSGKKILDLLHKVQTGKALNQYHSIIKLQKLEFVPATREDFQWDIDFYTKAEKDGWVKDYERWRERQEQEQ